MEELIKIVYRIADIRTTLLEISEFAYCYNWHEIKKIVSKKISDEMVWLVEYINEYNVNLAINIWKEMQSALDILSDNSSITGDIISNTVVPMINSFMAEKIQIELIDEKKEWSVLSTESGYLTLKNIKHNSYIHSTIDPMKEGKIQAEKIYKVNELEYVFLGCGLGYLPYQIYKMSNMSADIVIFVRSQEMADYALMYGVLNRIDEDKLKLFIYDDILDYLHYVEENNCTSHIFMPTCDMEILSNEVDCINSLLINQSTTNTIKKSLEINFWNNVSRIKEDISHIKSNRYEEYMVIAAGPSLEEHIEYIRSNKGRKGIIAVGTVFSKLKNCGIEPDFVVISDPQEETYGQIEGLENESVKLVLSVNTYWKIAEAYKGPKYLYYNYNVSDFSELYMKEKNIGKMPIGGTVTCLAIEMAVFLGTRVIELIGVDLAYPSEKTHVSGTVHDNEKLENDKMILVDSVNGGKVKTTKLMKTYIGDIETQIENYHDIVFVNKSSIGAKIRGTISKQ